MGRRLIRRTALVVLLVVTLVAAPPVAVTSVTSQPAAAAAGQAVQWQIDRAARTITVTVNLTFFPSSPIPAGRDDQFNGRIAYMVESIKKWWDGQRYKCFTLKVVVNQRTVGSQAEVGANEVPVMIDSAIYPIGSKLTFRVGDSDNSIRRSYVTRDPSAASNDYLSESASDAIRPATGPTEAPSVWYPYEDSWAYAHEFGHIMGLHDSYEDKVGPDGTTGSVTREGAVSDAMATKAPIDATTITRLIKRSGLDPKELRCSMSWDIPLSDITIPFTMIAFSLHAWACDYDAPSSAPGSKPVIVFEGDFFGYGVHDDPIAGGGTADSLTRFTTTYHVDDPRLVVQLGLPLHQKVRFRDGILVARENAFIRSTIDLYIDAVSEFKFDAPECPP